MEQYIIVYSKYIITLFLILYTVLSFFRVFCTETGRKKYDNLQSAFIFVIQFAAFLTICVEKGDVDYLFFYAMSQIAIFTAMMMFSMIYPGINRLLVNHMCLLLGTGFVILTRLDLGRFPGRRPGGPTVYPQMPLLEKTDLGLCRGRYYCHRRCAHIRAGDAWLKAVLFPGRNHLPALGICENPVPVLHGRHTLGGFLL